MTVFLSQLAPEIRQTNGFVQFLASRVVQGHKYIVIFLKAGAISVLAYATAEMSQARSKQFNTNLSNVSKIL
jgi:hypothetical protein